MLQSRLGMQAELSVGSRCSRGALLAQQRGVLQRPQANRCCRALGLRNHACQDPYGRNVLVYSYECRLCYQSGTGTLILRSVGNPLPDLHVTFWTAQNFPIRARSSPPGTMHSTIRPNQFVVLRLSSGLHKIVKVTPNTYVSRDWARCASSPLSREMTFWRAKWC